MLDPYIYSFRNKYKMLTFGPTKNLQLTFCKGIDRTMAFQSSLSTKTKTNPLILLHNQSQTRRSNPGSTSKPLSAQCIMAIAKTRLLRQIPSQNKNDSIFQSGLSDENLKDIELAHSLLEAAEKLSLQQFDSAEKLLHQCLDSSFPANNPIQRVVKFFAEALKETIDEKMRRVDIERNIFDEEEYILNNLTALVACGLKLPFNRVTKFAGIQAVLDNLGSATRIHFIDLRIRSGSHCIILMQGLSNRENCKLDLLKITAIGTSKYELKETGKRLSSFAESLNLPFLFQTVISEMQDLKEESFYLEDDEVVALYSGLILHSLLSCLDHLKSFVGFVKKVLKPCVMVVTEFEADTDTEIFTDRFHEVISFTSAVFDCFEACLKDECFVYREVFEEVFFMLAIRNSIVAENEERSPRYARIDYWREFLGGFGIVESEMSQSCLCQSSLMVKTCECWRSCTLDMNGKCLILKWNGTPIESLSVWKFQHQVAESN